MKSTEQRQRYESKFWKFVEYLVVKLSNQHQFYESEPSKFIRELKQKNTHLEEQQRNGRALLWDKAPIDLDDRARALESRIKQKPYAYQSKV